ncbi:TetR/AcrR family tetracycline transcriptional repressor [Caulobacter ginsengisoli]|uniref:TetR/AcrR family tetracycline transcriptional repressor n=1 Tax=Caulobacter ginsengisoli TaxID=400775 RepID=A0ABU0IT28_9CAUL|nr:TetR/AcrR family transcriptional regulator C-terminal domain-containing protein [Caulobacter ginsengisoli]MDQ0465140.1 TetR/AcrR family tetracycline transcriptional repressor [Caulobacter ginsengisoli]
MALERGAIVEAALALLDEVGLEGLSTRRLAARLGVQGPSLYWHFKTMAQLHDHMAEAMLAGQMPSADPAVFPGDWRHWLAEGARAMRRVALSRRDGARVLSAARPTGKSPVLSYPAMVGRLEAAGFTAQEGRDAMMTLGRYVLGWTLHEQAAGLEPDSDRGFEFGLEAMLNGVGLRLEAKAG